MEEKYQLNQVFTPSSPAKINFVEREDINQRVVRALRTPGMQLIIYGRSGSGKTTLLENKLFQVYERHLRTSCMKGMSYQSVLLDAFDQLSGFYLTEESKEDTSSIDVSIRSNFQLIDSQIKATHSNKSTQKTKRVLPPQLTAQNLARFMGAAGYCWILDDFHKVDGSDKKKLSQLMKVFMDMSSTYSNLKIICVGAENTAREVVQYDSEMKERVSEINVPLMSANEIKRIIVNGFTLLNIKFDNSAIGKDIYHYSNGLASICHKLCYLICESLNIHETTETTNLGNRVIQIESIPDFDDDWGENLGSYTDSENHHEYNHIISEQHDDELDEIFDLENIQTNSRVKVKIENLSYAISEYIDDASDTIKDSFDKAFLIAGSSSVLEALSECDMEGKSIDSLLQMLNENWEDISKTTLVAILEKLQSESGGSIIYINPANKICSFSTPFYMTFARSIFEHSSYKPRMTQGELIEVLNNAFNLMRRSY